MEVFNFIFFCSLILSSLLEFSIAADTITSDQSITIGPDPIRKKKIVVIVAVVSAACGMLVLSLLCWWIISRRAKTASLQTEKEDLELPLFDLVTVATATNNFSSAQMVGEGGFGPVYKAWLLWKAGKALELMDSCLEDSYVESQVIRCIQVGLLCVQQLPQDRPDMPSVVFMLGNEGVTLPQPKQPGFFIERNPIDSDASTNKEGHRTGNALTITAMEGR
ncbi:S-locus lectin protein kinase family protein [Actinidia rufa]|uniref:S-locus lectin protein kinase family protein n=1 Tax=Actinidia rufa TaxID=165716 RepID=A0A7J0G6X2_9ERIC|nr:S-locus lectin protein kinase family protein [Actinidia rufa]